jgi:integrase/recombinase XerC
VIISSDAGGVIVAGDSGEVSWSARRLLVAGGVALLHTEDTVLDAMLTGWTRQQLARRLEAQTAGDRRRVVRRFGEFSG